jgi:hypothetical protein
VGTPAPGDGGVTDSVIQIDRQMPCLLVTRCLPSDSLQHWSKSRLKPANTVMLGIVPYPLDFCRSEINPSPAVELRLKVS